MSSFENPFATPKLAKKNDREFFRKVLGNNEADLYLDPSEEPVKDRTADEPTPFEISDEEQWAIEAERRESEYFVLKNVPSRNSKFPSHNLLNKDFKVEGNMSPEFSQGRYMSDFGLTFEYLMSICTDADRSKVIWEEIKASKAWQEGIRFAKVFSIDEVIKQRQEMDPSHVSFLKTIEVFEAIDRAGFRPATLEELLAFGRDFWKPELGEIGDEHKKRSNSKMILALASVAKNSSNGDFFHPALLWDGDQRCLFNISAAIHWDGIEDVLVIKK